MNKLIAPIALLCAISAGLVFSCKKTKNSTAPTVPLNTVFADLRTTPQTLSVQAGRDTVIYGAKGTMLHFYTNSFKDASGATITSGTIGLQLVEMYKLGDMVQNRAPTTAGKNILVSGGEVNISATQNGNEVFTNGYGIGFKQNGFSSGFMSLFSGVADNSNSTINWIMSDTSRAGRNAFYSLITDLYQFDTCVNFNWVNCDRILDTVNSQLNTTVSVVLPDKTFVPQEYPYNGQPNTQIFIVLPATHSAINVRGNYNRTTNTVSINDDGSKIPIGLQYEIAVIANKNGTYYYWQTSGTTTDGLTVTAAPSIETRDDIKARMAGL